MQRPGLEDYLAPAAYDWTLREGEYTDNPLYSRILYMRGEHLATRLLRLKPTRQIHFYTNRDLLNRINETCRKGSAPFDWGELYRELFKPAPVLEERLRLMKEETGSPITPPYSASRTCWATFTNTATIPLPTPPNRNASS